MSIRLRHQAAITSCRKAAMVLAGSTLLIGAGAQAAESEAAAEAEATDKEAKLAELADPIVVIGQRDEYGVRSISTATKTNTDILDIPQSVTVVTEAQIEDQQLRSIADVLYFVPGATPGTGEGNRDQITLRGNNTTADLFVNSLRDDVQYFRDLYNVDRVEILRGPNAMIFGRGGGGGIVNRVTKRSSLNEYRQLIGSVDSYGGFRLTGDVDQPLADNVGLRVNGMYENGDSFRHHDDLKRYGINPTVGIQAGEDTRIDLSYEYLHDRRTADRGVPSASDGNPLTVDEPLKGFDRIFFGDPDKSYSKADVNLFNWSVEHHFSDALTLRNSGLFGDYDKFYQNIFPNGPATLADTVQLAAYNDSTKRRNLISQTDLIWENRLGGIEQTLLVGFELGRQKSKQRRKNGFFLTPGLIPSERTSLTVPLSDPTVDVDVVFLPFNTSNGCLPSNPGPCTPTNFTKSKAHIAAIYVQDQIQLSPMFEIVAGLRFDHFKLDVTNLNNGLTFNRSDNLWSPRIGLLFKPLENLSIYASYSRSYLPQSGDQFSSLDVTTEALKPERFDNYEIGAKWEPIEGLLATAAIYRLDRTNTRATDPVTLLTVLTGEQRSKGIELGLERNLSDNWQIAAGYAWQKAEITETTTAAPAGRNVPLVPRNSFSLWTRYDVSNKLGLGFGAVARSKSYASISNLVKLPGYARFDAAVFYQITRDIEAQINVENLFGADYFPTAHNDNNIAPGAPTNVKAAVRFGF